VRAGVPCRYRTGSVVISSTRGSPRRFPRECVLPSSSAHARCSIPTTRSPGPGAIYRPMRGNGIA
jgi:hypothetical protein